MAEEPLVYVQDLPAPPARPRWPYVVLGSMVFAAAVTLGPSLFMSNSDAGGSDGAYAAQHAGRVILAAAPEANEEPEPVPPPDADGTVPSTPATVPGPAAATMPPTTAPPMAVPVEPTDPAVPPADGGMIGLALDYLTEEPEDDDAGLSDGDEVTWTLVVENAGNEYLWGVYGYLEGFGPVACEDRRLDVGEETQCTAIDTVWLTDEAAQAWATAWTLKRMVAAETIVRIDVAPG